MHALRIGCRMVHRITGESYSLRRQLKNHLVVWSRGTGVVKLPRSLLRMPGGRKQNDSSLVSEYPGVGTTG